MKKNVSNVIMQLTFNFLNHEGVDVSTLKSRCNISQYEIDKSGGRISGQQHIRFLREISEFGVLWRERFLSTEFNGRLIADTYTLFPDLIGYCLNQKNAKSVILNYIKNRIIIGNCDTFTIIENDSEIEVRYKDDVVFHNSDSAIGNFMIITELVKLYDPSAPLSVGFVQQRHSQREVSQINDYFNCKCHFGCDFNFISFGIKSISHPFEQYNATLNENQRVHIETITTSLNKKEVLSSIILDMLEDVIEDDVVDNENGFMNYICTLIGMSRWTLNGRLQQEGTNFTQLVKEMRLKKSCEWLSETTMSIQYIGDKLCFSSGSVFSRFFTANMGVTPLHFRKRFKRP